ncbi:2,5-diamino-6-(ribosylamino)-4(3H)-pyrimidinone 5'-phosphate reductase [Mortierella alpina]|uniref:2,5-diamino-6-ribosylamino-4(3H)-pyrimidinone 5'-phosphate reductase n=1 Tax=Mortierella alpina TaxID=64518 RepID=A0A9P6LW99_MORAP|nr:2,5-diamino-6-(ribosylamino)-4(3H)-pyrimidinone 5'-phosphate reductase [Mortierella alpina]
MYSFLSHMAFAPAPDAAQPHVTLTFAQSLDGKIAGKHGQQLILSGPQSMKATHILRSRHDAILVGIGTVLNDDPRLTVRLSPEDLVAETTASALQHPQPVILDTALRFPRTAKLLLPTAPKKPWIVTGPIHNKDKRLELEALGARVFVLEVDAQGRVTLPELLSTLYQQSIQSLMVEGGAGVISSFLKSGLVQSFLLTIAPVYVGEHGVSAVQDAEGAPVFRDISYHSLGQDVMMVAKPAS